ncbi:transglutaminase domain-containing protein [Cyanobacterium stanieri PCC 7202]|uniref:Transglutaminase domain-containing protein n=1 Tax=Cyanobacterium stanieri (strain ATCC 29140 / PCC 7202) TaxID=292563 RepID=K9YHU1_CYASC|nr:transglutaminase domain-containing protein [Cyanobacterium stanieri PCC 7202]
MIEQLKRFPTFERIIQQIESLPPLKTEESILFRVLVQLMVIVGIVATDVAAMSQFPMSVWAIPLSILGGVVSWHRRKKKNITLKFILAIAMVATLFFFLGNLIRSLFDNRLVLAEFLVQLQVLHSFDLPRRKDLGYSMVIGFILIGVAGTLSQTVAFAPWLLLFLIITIPTMILDYRSRIGLATYESEYRANRGNKNQKQSEKNRQWLKNSPLSPKKITSFLTVTLVVGLLIFAIMPRYPGYQLQTFPVSAPQGLEDLDFSQTDRGIVSPGYNRDGSGAGGGGLSGEGGAGTGQVDDTFYYGFNTTIDQNLRGTITNPRVVLRVRSQAPGFWRALAFDHYTGQGWDISRDEQTMDVDRNRWNFQFNFSLPNVQGETERVIQTYTVVSDLPNIIPLLSSPQHLYFPTEQVAVDTEGSLRSPTGLLEGLTYTVVSRVRKRDQTQLSQAGTSYPESIANYYLDVPDNIRDLVRERAEELLSRSPNELTSNYAKALYLAQAIKQNYRIDPDIPPLEEGEDLAQAFLQTYQGGYPDHFATVYTLMLRSLDIPARLVVGFSSGNFNPFTGYYVVRNIDAYAMTEVYFPDYGWFYFDPLPGNEIIPPSVDDDNTFGVLGQLWDWVASWLPSPIVDFITILFTDIINAISGFLSSPWLTRLWGFFTGSFMGILVGAMVLIFLSFIGWLGFNFIQKQLYRLRLAKLDPMEKLYLEMIDFLSQKGYPKHKAQTPKEYAQRLREFLAPEQLEIIDLISTNFVAWRYGQQGYNIDYLSGQFNLLKSSFKSKVSKQLTMDN